MVHVTSGSPGMTVREPVFVAQVEPHALEKRMIEGSLEDTYKLYDSMDNPKKTTR